MTSEPRIPPRCYRCADGLRSSCMSLGASLGASRRRAQAAPLAESGRPFFSPLFRALLIACCGPLFVGGCGDSSQGTIQGVVTWEGAPLAEGEVRFVPPDGKGQTANAPIADGAFAATLPVGVHRVEFSAPKIVGKRKMYDAPDSPTVDEVRELLPPRYNVRSELTLEILPGRHEAAFDLREAP